MMPPILSITDTVPCAPSWWFYRTAEPPLKRFSPLIRKMERGNPDVTLSDSPAPFPRI
jgi:hypothetical protein